MFLILFSIDGIFKNREIIIVIINIIKKFNVKFLSENQLEILMEGIAGYKINIITINNIQNIVKRIKNIGILFSLFLVSIVVSIK